MKLLKRDVREQIIIILSLVFVVALLTTKTYLAILTLGVTLTVSVVTDYLLTAWLTGHKYFPKSAVISSLLIALNINPSVPLFVFAVTGLIAMIGKSSLRVIKFSDLHAFNPAAAGIIIAQLIFGITGVWWGVANTNIATLIILALGGGYVLMRLKRLYIPIGFLLTYAVGVILLFSAPNISTITKLLLDGTVFLFVFIILPEPQTSPAVGIWKYIFGVLVAAVLLFVLKFSFLLQVGKASLDAFLISLLIADLISFAIRWVTGKIPKKVLSSNI